MKLPSANGLYLLCIICRKGRTTLALAYKCLVELEKQRGLNLLLLPLVRRTMRTLNPPTLTCSICGVKNGMSQSSNTMPFPSFLHSQRGHITSDASQCTNVILSRNLECSTQDTLAKMKVLPLILATGYLESCQHREI